MLIVSLLTIITLYANFVNRENKNLNFFEFRFFMVVILQLLLI